MVKCQRMVLKLSQVFCLIVLMAGISYCKDLKLGVIDRTKVMQMMPEYTELNIRANKKMEKINDIYNTNSSKETETFQNVQSSLVKASSEKEKKELSTKLKEAAETLKAEEIMFNQAKDNILSEQAEELLQLNEKIKEVSKDICKKRGLDLVVDSNLVLFGDGANIIDVTEDFRPVFNDSKYYNENYTLVVDCKGNNFVEGSEIEFKVTNVAGKPMKDVELYIDGVNKTNTDINGKAYLKMPTLNEKSIITQITVYAGRVDEKEAYKGRVYLNVLSKNYKSPDYDVKEAK